MRLIDADALVDQIKLEAEADTDKSVQATLARALTLLVCKAIEGQPTIEPQRKKGKWMESDTDGFVCSVCRNGYRCQPTLMGKPMFEYCPVCGAKMEG